MKRFKLTALVGAVSIFLASLATPLMAGNLGIGITGAGTFLKTSGTETLKQSKLKSIEETQYDEGMMPSGFLQYTFGEDGFVIGVEWAPGDVSLGSKTTQRTQLSSAVQATTTVEQYVQANVTDAYSAYIETPGFTPLGIFAKVGAMNVRIETNETLGTGAAYSDVTDVVGGIFGLGFKGSYGSGVMFKLDAQYVDFEDISISSTGSDASTTIDAETAMKQIRLSVGYNF